MTDENKRAEAARAHDDHELIDDMEPAPSFGGSAGGNLKRDIATRAELEHLIEGEEESVTRVRAGDKKTAANVPRFNER